MNRITLPTAGTDSPRSGRQRHGWRAGVVMSLALTCAACIGQTTDEPTRDELTSGVASDDHVGSRRPTPTTATTPSTVPLRSAPAPSSPSTDQFPGEGQPIQREPCTLDAAGFDHLLVFGNSTDYTFGPDEHISMTAWPELLILHDRTGLLDDVTVRNEAQPGQTMGDWDAWGPDPRLRLNGYARSVLDTLEPRLLQTTLVLVAPSFIDLQESGFDIDRAISDLSVVLTMLESYGLQTLVLPMNYVSTTLNERLPELNPAIEGFNRLLGRRGLLVGPVVDSPLRDEGQEVGGDDRLYDEFPGRTRDGTFLGPDGFHLDHEGQLLKTRAVIRALAAFLEQTHHATECL